MSFCRVLRLPFADFHLLFGLALVSSLVSEAAGVTRTWPGAAPCNGTLQACIDASANDDTVLVASNGPIDETLTINKRLNLHRAPGFLPRFSEGRSITTGPSAWRLSIDGLRFTGGSILANPAGPAEIEFINNVFEAGAQGGGRIQILNNNVNHSLSLRIENNRLLDQRRTDGFPVLRVLSAGLTTGRIAFNHIEAPEVLSGRGIDLDLGPSLSSSVAVFNNRILGGFEEAAIHLGSDEALITGSFSSLVVRAIGNVLSCPGRNIGETVGIRFATRFAATYTVQFLNNTVVGCSDTGLLVDSVVVGSDVSGVLSQNLMAGNLYPAIVSGNYSADFQFDRNLVHDNGFVGLPPSATNTITADPLLFSPEMPRPGAGSPAIDAANAALLQLVLAQAGLPQVDADGRRRTIGPGQFGLDIGAFEFGDRISQASKSTPPGNNLIELDLPGEPGARPQVSKVFNPSPGNSVENALPMAVFELGDWFAYAMGGTTPQSATLNLFVPGVQSGFGSNYLHVTTAANSTGPETRLSQTFLNGRGPDQAVVLATAAWQGGTENARFTGVTYVCDPLGAPGSQCWAVTNLGIGEAMPEGVGFHVYAQDPSPNAFRHRVGQSGLNNTRLDYHPILGNDPLRCARPQAAVFLPNSGQAVNAAWDFEHDGVRSWTIFSYGGPFPASAEFNVFVDQRAFEECVLSRQDSLFADRFEG
ncbi:DUF7452 domain-containing protein [Wenzhouxiangella marina]|uniref:DUF7452 domain-containing protein n=1 Tax=Wenzhouxiangella marina TaxID=1579979 RepID=A0A0K0XW10_9GAMM|nr:choice-of-anchor Q domain-containing protein [Wenzhouxiangella marina]AKS41860.1 hypothetical protein WM2015_1489 [Wenzhouxiangella marina]MBB6086374.1 hypothetical protein [Wenzhouxiangella marina]